MEVGASVMGLDSEGRDIHSFFLLYYSIGGLAWFHLFLSLRNEDDLGWVGLGCTIVSEI